MTVMSPFYLRAHSQWTAAFDGRVGCNATVLVLRPSLPGVGVGHLMNWENLLQEFEIFYQRGEERQFSSVTA